MSARLTQEHLDLVHAQETASLTSATQPKVVEAKVQDASLREEPSPDEEVILS
jgi:hypothetical protein